MNEKIANQISILQRELKRKSSFCLKQLFFTRKSALLLLPVFWMLFEITVVQSQTYHPFPTQNASWAYLHLINLSEFDPTPSTKDTVTVNYEINGDTTINGKTYLKVYGDTDSVFQANSEHYFYKAAMREEDKIVYYVPPYLDSEVAIYNFNLSPGEIWIKAGFNDVGFDIFYSLETIDSIELEDGNFRKRYNITFVDTILFSNHGFTTWIEGIGNTQGLFYFPCFLGEPHIYQETLLCFSKEDSLLYINPETFNSYGCHFESDIIDNLSEQDLMKSIKIFPNPVSEKLSIQSAFPIYSVELTDLTGKVVFQQKMLFKEYDLDIDSKHFLTGIYFLKITIVEQNAFKSFVSKVLKK